MSTRDARKFIADGVRMTPAKLANQSARNTHPCQVVGGPQPNRLRGKNTAEW